MSDNDRTLLGYVEFSFDGAIPIYADDPESDDIGSLDEEGLAELFAHESRHYIENDYWTWSPR
jgi:hypothetical protein